jgi:membrane protein YdbS with pleckstrin-like domain
MIARIREHVLKALRVPAAPAAPAGAPGSLRVFHAGRRFYHLRLAVWALGQAAALGGILFSFAFLKLVRDEVDRLRALPPPAAVSAAPSGTPPPPAAEPSPPAGPATPASRPSRRNRQQERGPVSEAAFIARKLPPWVFPLATVIELIVLLGFLATLPFTYAVVRLDYELRWYLVTDRSLRIREGITRIHEMTMSFANIQQVVVRQNPVQRILGIADLQVQSAGGGGDSQGDGIADSLHTGVFHGVDNAVEIRDLILARLRDFRECGLGDPDDAPAVAVSNQLPVADAARQLLAEARELRRALAPRPLS